MTSSNFFEIESTRLALARSQTKLLKEFADQMAGDHTPAANRTRQVVAEMREPAAGLSARCCQYAPMGAT